jgi:motility quorum-sensing regulator/GCU-specific mRNA interferase toxin
LRNAPLGFIFLEKLKPTHDLEAFKRTFAKHHHVSTTALRTAQAIDYDRDDIDLVVSRMRRSEFVKSVTSFGDHRHWQDVYHVLHRGRLLYLKFTDDTLTEFVLLSFKRK